MASPKFSRCLPGGGSPAAHKGLKKQLHKNDKKAVSFQKTLRTGIGNGLVRDLMKYYK